MASGETFNSTLDIFDLLDEFSESRFANIECIRNILVIMENYRDSEIANITLRESVIVNILKSNLGIEKKLYRDLESFWTQFVGDSIHLSNFGLSLQQSMEGLTNASFLTDIVQEAVSKGGIDALEAVDMLLDCCDESSKISAISLKIIIEFLEAEVCHMIQTLQNYSCGTTMTSVDEDLLPTIVDIPSSDSTSEIQSKVEEAVPKNTNKDSNCDKMLCFICCERVADTMLEPCGHNHVCHKCAKQLTERAMTCPECRSEISSLKRMNCSFKSQAKRFFARGLVRLRKAKLSSKKTEKSASNEITFCPICTDRPATRCLVPCGHVGVCEDCGSGNLYPIYCMNCQQEVFGSIRRENDIILQDVHAMQEGFSV